MLMSILCPLNLSVRFLWCVQFLSIKHRGVKQAGGRLVPLLQAWISPFGFIFILNGEEGEIVWSGLWNTEGAMWWYEEFWEPFVPFTELITNPQTSSSIREYVNILQKWFFISNLSLKNYFKCTFSYFICSSLLPDHTQSNIYPAVIIHCFFDYYTDYSSLYFIL